MHEIEPFYNWENFYSSESDELSPFYGVNYNLERYTNDIYGYYIHPLWDYIGSETLYIKILFADYKKRFAVIEMFGEWNDTLHNDIMHLKRNVIEQMIGNNINHFILIGENVLNFHASDDCYYEEWFEEVEDGWIAAINFRDFVWDEWKKYHLDYYINFGGNLEIYNWRTLTPHTLYEQINQQMIKRLGQGTIFIIVFFLLPYNIHKFAPLNKKHSNTITMKNLFALMMVASFLVVACEQKTETANTETVDSTKTTNPEPSAPSTVDTTKTADTTKTTETKVEEKKVEEKKK